MLGISSFLVLIWLFSLLVFGACRDLHDKTKFFENGFCLENSLRFRCGNITGSTLRKVPHLHMCGDFALFMVCNISSFGSPLLVSAFPTELVSNHSEFICKRYFSSVVSAVFLRVGNVRTLLGDFRCSEISEPQSGDLRVAEDFYQVQISVAY